MDRRHIFLGARATTSYAGVVYALSVFAVGFVLGALRVFWVAPRIGAAAAVIVETPLMLSASWIICGRCIRRRKIGASIASRISMGAVALSVLFICEFALASIVFHRSVAAFFAEYGTLPGAIGLGAQIIFATFPTLQLYATATRDSNDQIFERKKR